MQKAAEIYRFIVANVEGKTAVRTGMSAAFGWIIGSHLSLLSNRPDRLLSGMWCVLTAIIVLQAHIGSTYRAAWNRFLGVLIGSLTGGFFTTYFGSSPLTLGVGIFFTVTLCSLFKVQESYRIASASVAVVTILSSLTPEISPWIFSFYRFLDSIIGIIIAMTVAHVIWPREAMDKMRSQLASIVRELDTFFAAAIDLTAKNRPIPSRAHEINELIQKGGSLLDESKPELFSKIERIENWTMILEDCQRLTESFSALDAVFKENTRKIMDAPLLSCIENKIELVHKAFSSLQNFFLLKSDEGMPDIEKGLDELKTEFARFRTTHSTRGYSLEDVENFFVFCYTLKEVLEILQSLKKNIKGIEAE